ncbi:hypothetical protein [Pectobacterium versatile]|uniref:Type III secretion protein n=1 Tax=Pectobacterium versatile TaxID=2488639 RepID=A0AAW3RXT0_9GAMM|nr:hypothetical protein [Pectobacterium versatile]MBA0160932.1 hypothetical protein [Pectobacterium versatile]
MNNSVNKAVNTSVNTSVNTPVGTVVLPSPYAEKSTETASAPLSEALCASSTLALFQRIQAAQQHAELPAIQPEPAFPVGVSSWMVEHSNSVVQPLKLALIDARIQTQADIDYLVSAVCTALINQANRYRNLVITQNAAGKAQRSSDAAGEELKRSLLAFMQRTQLQKHFSPDEMAALTEHVQKGNYKFAQNLAGQDVRFLADSPDWKTKADALASIPNASAVTVSILPTETIGNQVAVIPSGNGWTLNVWANGWHPVQCSDGAKALAVQERKHKLEFDKALQRSRPVITGMFPDLIQQAAEAEQYASAE